MKTQRSEEEIVSDMIVRRDELDKKIADATGVPTHKQMIEALERYLADSLNTSFEHDLDALSTIYIHYDKYEGKKTFTIDSTEEDVGTIRADTFIGVLTKLTNNYNKGQQ